MDIMLVDIVCKAKNNIKFLTIGLLAKRSHNCMAVNKLSFQSPKPDNATT